MMNKKKKILYLPFIMQIALYIIQFFIIPLFVETFPSDIDTILKVLFISSFLMSIFCELFNRIDTKFLLLSILLYFILVCAYHPNTLYGIDYGSFIPSIIKITLITILVLISQLTGLILIKSTKILLVKLRKSKNQ